MKEIEKVSFDSMPQLISESFLTKEQVEKLKEPFKDVVSVVRCKECNKRNTSECPLHYGGHSENDMDDDWFCADGKKK